MGVGISFKAVGTLVELAIPWILSYIIDDLIPLKEIRPVCLWGGLMIVCSLIAWGGNITANPHGVRCGARLHAADPA